MVYEKILNKGRDTLKRFPYFILLIVMLLVACGNIPGREATSTPVSSNILELKLIPSTADTTTAPRTQVASITNIALSTVTLLPRGTLTPVPIAGSNKITYAVSNEDFANPERGFMKQSSVFPEQPFDAQKVRALQPSDTLVWIYFRLDNYRDRLIDPNGLNNIIK